MISLGLVNLTENEKYRLSGKIFPKPFLWDRATKCNWQCDSAHICLYVLKRLKSTFKLFASLKNLESVDMQIFLPLKSSNAGLFHLKVRCQCAGGFKFPHHACASCILDHDCLPNQLWCHKILLIRTHVKLRCQTSAEKASFLQQLNVKAAFRFQTLHKH